MNIEETIKNIKYLEEWNNFYKKENVIILKKIRDIFCKIKNVKATDILNLEALNMLQQIEEYIDKNKIN